MDLGDGNLLSFVIKLQMMLNISTRRVEVDICYIATATRKSIPHSRSSRVTPVSGEEEPTMTMTSNIVSSEECWGKGDNWGVVSSLGSRYLPYLHF